MKRTGKKGEEDSTFESDEIPAAVQKGGTSAPTPRSEMTRFAVPGSLSTRGWKSVEKRWWERLKSTIGTKNKTRRYLGRNTERRSSVTSGKRNRLDRSVRVLSEVEGECLRSSFAVDTVERRKVSSEGSDGTEERTRARRTQREHSKTRT